MQRREAYGGTLVLGGGFAGAYVARLLGKVGSTIVSRENFMLYTPMLPEAASGTLEPRHVVVPLRMMCRDAELVLGKAVSLDLEGRALQVETEVGPAEIHYERLVVALGAVARTLPIQGLAEHALGFKSLADAIYLRNHVLRQLELADAALTADDAKRHLSFVFVGAGYAGVEALAELSDLLRDTARFYRRLKGVRQRWVLVDAAPKILPEIPRRLGDYAARELWKRGVDIRVSTTLESVDERAVTLSDGSRLETETCVWTAGVKANPLLGTLGLPLDDRGRVVVDSMLKVRDVEDVWSLGDCAAVPNEATPGEFDPPTSQHALRQARRLAKNLKGHLMLTSGDIDDNVHMANTLRMADALIKANKRFDFFVLPGLRHSYQPEQDYFFWVRSDYFCRWLLGKEADSVDIIELNREKEQTGSKKGTR